MIVVLPVCHKDADAALRNLAWAKELDSHVPFSCLIACENNFDRLSAIHAAASDYFDSVSVLSYAPYPKHFNQKWPRPQNWAWRKVAIHLVKSGIGPWLWWEQDAVPLRSGWLAKLEEAYKASGKPFLGTHGCAMPGMPQHMNGVAIYPTNWTQYAPESMLRSEALPFDSCGGWRIVQQATLSPLIQHLWSFDNNPSGPPCSFEDRNNLRHINKGAVLFHRCKDSSLIDQLREKPLGDPRSTTPKRRMWRKGDRGNSKAPCLIMLGGLGDVLLALPIAYHYSRTYRSAVPFITSQIYEPVLTGASYVELAGKQGNQWGNYTEAIAWAHSKYRTVYPMHVGEPGIKDNPATSRFCHEQYVHAGLPAQYGKYPLVFDQRNREREQKLIDKVHGGRPTLLYNLHGKTSPFSQWPALLESLRSHWRKEINLVSIPSLNLPFYQDLLGLMEVSIGVLSIDTSTIHLMPASPCPYIALLNDTKTPWWSSVPRGNCVLQLGYTKAMAGIEQIQSTIESMLKPAMKSSSGTGPTPFLVTLACNGMESVWVEAFKTWEPYCKHFGLPIQVETKMPRPDLHPSWNKIPLVLKALETNEVVWWIDSDITVARPNSPLPNSSLDLMFASDWNGLCACMFRARSTEWTRSFLNALMLLGDVKNPDQFGRGCGPKWEQNAIKSLMQTFPGVSQHIGLFPTAFVNDQPHRNIGESFCHFGARTNQQRIAAIRTRHKL